MVLAQGELWTAEAVDEEIAKGEQVRILAADGLKLLVTKRRDS